MIASTPFDGAIPVIVFVSPFFSFVLSRPVSSSVVFLYMSSIFPFTTQTTHSIHTYTHISFLHHGPRGSFSSFSCAAAGQSAKVHAIEITHSTVDRRRRNQLLNQYYTRRVDYYFSFQRHSGSGARFKLCHYVCRTPKS